MRRNRIAYICAAAALSAAVFFGCENTAGERGSSGGGSSSTAAESGVNAGTGSSGGNVFEEMPSEPTAEKKFIGTWVKADEKETCDPETITFRADGTYTASYKEGGQNTDKTWSATETSLYIMKQIELYPAVGEEIEFPWDGHILDISEISEPNAELSFISVGNGVYKNSSNDDPHTMLTITGSEFTLKWKTRVFEGTVSGDKLIENASGGMRCYSYEFSDGGNTLKFDTISSTYTKQR